MWEGAPTLAASRFPQMSNGARSTVWIGDDLALASGSVVWSGTRNEDIDESPRALLPVGTGRGVGDAGESPK